MPTTVEGHIEAALLNRVATINTSPALPVAWPNDDFKPRPQYLRVTHIPNQNDRLFFDGGDPHWRYGLLQLSVFAKKNRGALEATDLAGSVAAHFPADLEMTSGPVRVRVSKAPHVAQAIPDGAHWLVPVTVRYETFC